jgi:putative salt-induced outer membrane protein YdiY
MGARLFGSSLALALLCLGAARADEVVLVNGDRLTGEVLDAVGGKLRIKVDYAGAPLVLDMAKVRKITVTKPIEVRLKSGEVLKGQLQPAAAEGKVNVLGEGRGPAEVPWDQITAFNPPKVAWHGTVTLAYTDQGGNTERMGLSAAAEAQRRSEKDNFTMRVLYNYADEEGVMSARNVFGAAKYDYYFTRYFYAYASEELLSDSFRDLNLRAVTGAGAGWQIVEKPRLSLAVEAGVAHVNDDFREGEDDSRVAARVAGLAKVGIFKWLTVTDNLVYLPSLEGDSQYQFRNEAGVTTPLGAGWSLKFAHIFEYNSDPPDGVSTSDRTLILGLQYSF